MMNHQMAARLDFVGRRADDLEYAMRNEQESDAEETPNTTEGGQIKRQIKVYESRYNDKGRPELKSINPDKKDIDAGDKGVYAMRYYRYYNRDSVLHRVVLKIFSSHIQKALRTVVKCYPTQNFTGQPIILEGHAEYEAMGCLYHYREELQQYVRDLDDEEAKLDIQLVFKLIDEELKVYLERYETNVVTAAQPCVAFSDVWMIFKPGELLWTGKDSAETERILEIVGTEFREAGWGKPATWTIEAKCFAFNGDQFGYVSQHFGLGSFKGTRLLTRLDVQPLKCHPNQEALREKQTARGKKLCSLAGVRHCQYSGPATAVEHHKKPSRYGGCDEFTHTTVTVRERKENCGS